METTHQAVADANGIDRDPARRPGVPRERPPAPWPNTRFPPVRMRAPPSVPRYGPEHEPVVPVYGTAVPPRGLAGLVRQAAYQYPGHWMRHWSLLLLADRVDLWTLRTRRIVKVLVPGIALLLVARRALGRGGRRSGDAPAQRARGRLRVAGVRRRGGPATHFR